MAAYVDLESMTEEEREERRRGCPHNMVHIDDLVDGEADSGDIYGNSYTLAVYDPDEEDDDDDD